jgi:hypothetical protein
MQGKVCGGPATEACRACGGFYCAKHGGVRLGWPTCGPCLDRSRPQHVVGGLVMVGFGVFVLYTATRAGSAIIALMGIASWGMAAWGLREAMRPNPWVDRDSDE